MIGLLVQLNADLAKVWSISSHRFLTFDRDDVPNDCLEGHWIEIEFDSSRVMRGMKRTKDSLETRRDEKTGIQVLDVFLVDSRREEAFSETFGVVRVERGRGGERWTEEGTTKDNCFQLWMTISSKSEFTIEKQSLEIYYSKDGEHPHKYKRLMAAFNGIARRTPQDDVSDECMEFDETVLIVGYDSKAKVYFSSSRCGEAFINFTVWKSLSQEDFIEKGAIFRAKIVKTEGADLLHKIVQLYEKVDSWNGVYITITPKDMKVEVDAVVVERRETCFALETEPFGLVTYSLDRDFLNFLFSPTDIAVGAALRVVLMRFKKEQKVDHPSKWQVTRVIKILKRAEKKESQWFEGVVTNLFNPGKPLITFKLGSAAYTRNAHSVNLSLGDVVNMRVLPAKNEGWFQVVEMDEEIRTRKDLVVESFKDSKCVNVYCTVEVVDRCDGYFLLDTPIIGLALFFFREAPHEMEVGDVWRVRMLRRKDKQHYPSFWVATAVVGDNPRVSSSVLKRERDTVDHKGTSGSSSRDTLLSTSNSYHDTQWTTVLITGSDFACWYGSCAQADPVRIPKKLNQTGRNLERGEFYRIKLSTDRKLRVQQLDTERVYPRDIDFVFEQNEGIKLWCYAHIVDVHESAFTVHNELIGNATLPFKRMTKRAGLRVGDRLEALYYRVRSTDNPTHWMVQEAGLARSNYEDERGEGQKRIAGGADRIIHEGREPDDAHEVNERPVDTKPLKEGRMLEIMNRYMKIAEVREAFMKEDPATMEQIKKILERSMLK